MNSDMNDIVGIFFELWAFFIPFLLALVVHEYCHGLVANRLGDPTARLMGRLTLNPMAHADLIGTVILPIAAVLFNAPFFGWAKPVPVNSRNLKHEKRDMFLIAAAGPASNVVMAFIGGFALVLCIRLLPNEAELVAMMQNFIEINVALAVFNLIPVHPLDGGKILAFFISDRANRRMEELQPFFNIALILVFISGAFSSILGPPIFFGERLVVSVASHVLGAAI